MAIVTEIHPGELNQLRIESTGHMIVDAKYLIEIIRHMGGKNIHVMTVGDNMIQVSDENSKFNLFTLELERFALPDIKRPENEIKISLKNIRTTVDQIAYATSEKDARTMLMGVNFRSDGKRIITAATDSYRMALNYIDGEFSQNFNVTVPVRALQEAARIFKNDADRQQRFHHTAPFLLGLGRRPVRRRLSQTQGNGAGRGPPRMRYAVNLPFETASGN